MFDNLAGNIEYCKNIVESVAQILYYSHIPTSVVVLAASFFVYFKNRKLRLAEILLLISICFSIWSFLDLFIWFGYDNSPLLMFAWAPVEIFSVLLFMLSLYFLYVFIYQRDVPANKKIIMLLLLSPIIILSPTNLNLTGFNATECIASEYGPMTNYVLGLKIFLSLWMIFLVVKASRKADSISKKKLVILAVGVFSFIFAFLLSGFIAGYTENYIIEMYGLMAMIVFIISLARLVIEYGEFNLKVFSAQVLVFALAALVAAQFAFIQNPINYFLNSLTLVGAMFFGWILIKSVKREVALRESLQVANEGQENLIHVMNHQIKGYLAKARNIFSELLTEPTYGPVSEPAKPMIEEGFRSLTEGVGFVQDILTGSSAQSGKIQYNMQPLDMKNLLLGVFEKEKSHAEEKKLALEISIDEGDYNLKGDEGQLRQAVRNLIENSIIYTKAGEVKIHLSKPAGKILLTVKDTGIGISEEDKPRLFTKGGKGKDSLKVNVNSSGYGLAFVKGVVEAHKGRVWAESAGSGQGSTFFLELPTAS